MMKNLGVWLRALIYPRDIRCALCGVEIGREGCVCEKCEKLLPPQPSPRTDIPNLGFVQASYSYEEPIDGAVKRFKNNNQRFLARFFASSMTEMAQGRHLIVPVPLHAKKRAKRGFSQTEELCRELSVLTGVPWRSVCVRVKETGDQKLLGRADRLENVKDAFDAPDPRQVAGKRILLVDDVVTTGATMSACAEALVRAGAASVVGATVASR